MVFHPEDNQKKRILFVQCAQEVSVRRSEDSRRGAALWPLGGVAVTTQLSLSHGSLACGITGFLKPVKLSLINSFHKRAARTGEHEAQRQTRAHSCTADDPAFPEGPRTAWCDGWIHTE